MGNLHGLLQVRPIASVSGIALPVRVDAHPAFWADLTRALPRYMSVETKTPTVSIHNTNIGSNVVEDVAATRVYLVLGAGGKWGYDDEFWDRVETLAPVLEDALWYFDDEYTGFVERFEIVDGELQRRMVVDEGSSCLDYVMESGELDDATAIALHGQNARTNVDIDLFEYALEELEAALALDPDHRPSQLEAARTLNRLGRVDEALGRLHELQVSADRALEAGGSWPEDLSAHLRQVYLELGRCEWGRGDHDAAQMALSAASEITPTWGDEEPTLERARLYRSLGRLVEAQVDLEVVLKQSSRKAQLRGAMVELGHLHVARGEPDGARRRFEQALELGPGWEEREVIEGLVAGLLVGEG